METKRWFDIAVKREHDGDVLAIFLWRFSIEMGIRKLSSINTFHLLAFSAHTCKLHQMQFVLHLLGASFALAFLRTLEGRSKYIKKDKGQGGGLSFAEMEKQVSKVMDAMTERGILERIGELPEEERPRVMEEEMAKIIKELGLPIDPRNFSVGGMKVEKNIQRKGRVNKFFPVDDRDEPKYM